MLTDIIGSKALVEVHGNANFGSMTPRQVVNDGVLKYSMGFTGGSAQLAILRDHGLITKPNGYRANLTEKGKLYLRSLLAGKLDQVLEICEQESTI